MQLPVSFVVYWLIVKDFFWNLDSCEDDSAEHGYCLSNSECNNIANGTVLGSCESETSSRVCCRITVNYYNTTYILQRMFAAKNPTDKPQKIMLFSSKSHDSFQIDYDNRTITSKRSTQKTQVVRYDERVHGCVSPDRIFWPITATYYRESRDLKIKRPSSGTTYLYFVELNKIYDDETDEKKKLTMECLSKLNKHEPDAPESGENEKSITYLKVNKEVIFPLRKFFTPEIQNLKNANFTGDFKDLFPEPEPQKRRSSNYGTCKEDSVCEKEESVDSDIERPEVDDIVRSQSDTSSDTQLEKRKLSMEDFEPHDSESSVLLDIIYNIRKPVQTDPTHDMRKPVQTDATHDMRKPVSLDESHDLRWPVIEEESDLRNVYDEDYQNYLINLFKERVSKTPVFDCTTKIPLTDEHVRNFDPSRVENLTRFWEDTFRACGDFSEETTNHFGIAPNRKWPWMVSLQEKKSGKYRNKCSAALLNSKWVITVAHCVDMKYKSDFKLLLGNQSSKGNRKNYTEREIEEIFIHQDFKRGMFENDLALLKMKTPVKYNSDILPICLPASEAGEDDHGIPVFLSGKRKQKSKSSQSTVFPIMTNSECEMLYSVAKKKEKIKDTFICVGKNEGNCDSESGSSLISPNSEDKWLLIGLVSWGSMCSNLEQPSVYVRIAKYFSWIRDIIDCYELYI